MTKNTDNNFFKRWSKKKTEELSQESLENSSAKKIDDKTQTNEKIEKENEENKLSDFELCKKYDLPDINKCKKQKDFDVFLTEQIPERLRYMALRQIWRLNPIFSSVSELVEYGEDFTDAATVVPNMETAYKVGKGYLDKLIEAKENLVEISDKNLTSKITKTNKLEKSSVKQNKKSSKIKEIENAQNKVSEKNIIDNSSGNKNNFNSNYQTSDEEKDRKNNNEELINNKHDNNEEENKEFIPKRMVFKKLNSEI